MLLSAPAALVALASLVVIQDRSGQEPAGQDPAGTDESCCRTERKSVDPALLPKDRKSVLLRDLAKTLTDGKALFVGEGTLRELEGHAANLSAKAPPRQFFSLYHALGQARLEAGRIEDAIAAFERAKAAAEAENDREDRMTAMRKLALAWMRLGERANCVGHHNRDSCIFPLKDGGIHVAKEGSEKAAAILLEILRTMDPNDLPAMWLLNVAHMTLGTWPEGVPVPFRIEKEALASEYELPRMYDVAESKGIRLFARAGGSCIDDFDGDGRLDVVLTSMDVWEPMRMYRQKPDGTFVDVADAVGLSGQLGGLQFIHFDANNDGRLDLLVQRGAWMMANGQIPNSLLIQQPDGTFLDRTQEAGIEIAAPSQAAAVADIDNDGDLDLFLGYEAQGSPAGGIEFPSHLFRNRGDGTFEDVTATAGVENNRFCKGCAFGDYDGDRFPDLYVSNQSAPNRLYRNNRDGTFTDVAIPLRVFGPHDGFACWFFDYNNDGNLDLYATCYGRGTRAAEVCAYYKNGTTGYDSQRLYEGDGKGKLKDVTRAVHLDRPVFPMGCNFGDIDEDGWPDIYLGTGDPDFTSIWPNVMYRNDGGRRFQDVTTATGTGILQKGHGVSFGDLDGDGDQDLLEQLGGAVKDDAFKTVLFENPGHGNHWLTVRIVGHATNRFGVGVRIGATIEEPAGEQPAGSRTVYAFVGSNSSFGGNSLQEEMGLGKARRITALEVYWPTTGKTDRFTDVPLDRTIVVEEGVGWREAAPAEPRGG